MNRFNIHDAADDRRDQLARDAAFAGTQIPDEPERSESEQWNEGARIADDCFCPRCSARGFRSLCPSCSRPEQ